MKFLLKILILSLPFFSISCGDKEDPEIVETIETKEPLSPNRIAWDYSSLQKLVPLSGNFVDYSSYPRMIELANGDFMCVYEANGNIDIIRSSDKAQSWEQPVRIATFHDNTVMAVPEIIQLQNGDIIISYNPRPSAPYTEDRRFAMALKISKDNGLSWGAEKVVFEADYIGENGCWEPQIIELPTKELQLYFANENDYKLSHEQNISMLTSLDNGETWSERKIVSFSPTSRDGMPVALYLENTGEIIMSIEDNFQNNFKPAIIRTSNNWANAPVGRNNSDRFYALSHNLRTPAYQGAPYIRKTPKGNIILSYQGTDGESNSDLSNSRMLVEIGDNEGRNFTNSTRPFVVPTGKSALWSSLSVMDNRIWALTSTHAYNSSTQEVWTIAAYEISNYKLPKTEMLIDGAIDNPATQFPFFVGHKSMTNVSVDLSQSDSKLYAVAKFTDSDIIDSEGFVLNLATKNTNAKNPVTGNYMFTLTANGSFAAQKGANGNWEDSDISPDEIKVLKGSGEFIVEFSLSWDKIGGKPQANTKLGFSVGLVGVTSEDLANSNRNEPYTWGSIEL